MILTIYFGFSLLVNEEAQTFYDFVEVPNYMPSSTELSTRVLKGWKMGLTPEKKFIETSYFYVFLQRWLQLLSLIKPTTTFDSCSLGFGKPMDWLASDTYL